MSTTTDRDVAMQYAASGGKGVVFEIQMGMIDRGANIGGAAALEFLVTGMQFLPRKTLREAQSIYISPAASSASCVPHKRFQ